MRGAPAADGRGDDPATTLVRLAKEADGVGIAAGHVTTLVVKIEAVGPCGHENRFEFARHLRTLP